MAATSLSFAPPLHFGSSRRSRLRPTVVPVRAFGRSDIDSFARRAWRATNDRVEQLAFEARRAAERLDRQWSLSSRFDSAARAAASRVREIDQELGIGRWWRSVSVDFSRNWPRYRKQLNEFSSTPLGRGVVTVFFLWFALSGWMFRFFILATWLLPFAAPLIIGSLANNLAIEGSCPACKRRFVGFKNQIISCTGCGNIVWQPKGGFPGRRNNSTPKASDPDIIDIEIEEK